MNCSFTTAISILSQTGIKTDDASYNTMLQHDCNSVELLTYNLICATAPKLAVQMKMSHTCIELLAPCSDMHNRCQSKCSLV